MFLMSVLGYQRELTYKRTDGSYSAFGNSDSEGNMWYVPYETFFSVLCDRSCVVWSVPTCLPVIKR